MFECSEPDFFRERNHHQAKSRAQWRAHGGTSDLFKDSRADRELGHLEGHANNGLDIPNDDLASDIQCAARSAFAEVTHLIAP